MNIACYIQSDTLYQQVHVALIRAGFDCERFVNEMSFLRSVNRRNFELILADIGADLSDGEGLLSWLNCRSGEATPVVAVSSVRNPELAALTLDAGADDFIVSPFDSVELVARLNAVLRRCNRRNNRRSIELLGFSLDREANTFTYHGVQVDLTPREFTMAWLFFSTPGIYISRETMGIAIWGVDSNIAGRTIEQHVYKLRKKLQLGSERGVFIRTAYTHGYKLELSKKKENQQHILPVDAPDVVIKGS